jgi:hypothetical protein
MFTLETNSFILGKMGVRKKKKLNLKTPSSMMVSRVVSSRYRPDD